MKKLYIFASVGLSVFLSGCLQTMAEIPTSDVSLKDIQTRRFMYDEKVTTKGIHSYFDKERKCFSGFARSFRCKETGFLADSRDIFYSVEITSGANYTDVRIRRQNAPLFETYQEIFDAISKHIKYEASK